jgi:quercetin 2,3-dioxygenase
MLQQHFGKLFLADQRDLLETSAFRRYSTFQSGVYAHEHQQPFGRLHALNEETLAGGQTVTLPVSDAALVLIVPITDVVWAGTTTGVAALVAVEELHVLRVAAGDIVEFTNPSPTELVSFLHIWLSAPAAGMSQIFTFDLQDQPNQLVAARPVVAAPLGAVAAPLPFQVRMGRFAGRRQAGCPIPTAATARFLAFVLVGAFEVEGRLLHAGDGLALWNISTVELEAMSNDAVVLTLELAA